MARCTEFAQASEFNWQDSGGNPNVVVLYDNAGNRKLNLNYRSNRWNDNYRFLAVRNSLRGSAFLGGVLFLLFNPSAEHISDFKQMLRNSCVLFIINRLEFPGDVYEEFYVI